MQFGKLGFKPVDRLDSNGAEIKDKHGNDLKMGTIQSTFHVPGYTGFIPTAKTAGVALDHALANQTRNIQKTQVLESL